MNNMMKKLGERFSQKKLYSLDAKMSKFLGNVFQWLKYSREYADWWDENGRGVEGHRAFHIEEDIPQKQ